MTDYKPHPLRVQRRKGERLKPCECWVGCGRWGNPFLTTRRFESVLSGMLDPSRVIAATPDEFVHMGQIAANVKLLRGFRLVCDCPLDRPCHADALAREANK